MECRQRGRSAIWLGARCGDHPRLRAKARIVVIGSAMMGNVRDAPAPLEEVELSVEGLAAVHAGELDGFTVAEVLATEGISAGMWTKGRAGLTRDVARDPRTFSEYRRHLEVAQDRLFREVSPLFEDAGAWATFLALSDARGVDVVLRAHDLTHGDLARLERHWRRCAERDVLLGKRLQQLRARVSKEPELRVVVGARRPRPAANKEGARHEEARAGVAIEPHRIDRVACLAACLEAGVPMARIATRFGITTLVAAEHEVALLAASLGSVERRAYRGRLEHHRRAIAAVRRDETGELDGDLLEREVLPFVGSDPESALARCPPVPASQIPDAGNATVPIDPRMVPKPATPFPRRKPAIADHTAFLRISDYFDEDGNPHPAEKESKDD
jgi:hypothetical protein